MNKKELSGQLSLFDMLQEESEQDYLQKGEKIMSLLREKERKGCRFHGNTFFDMFSTATYFKKRDDVLELEKYLLQRIANGIIRPAMRETSGEEFVAKLFPGMQIDVSVVPKGSYEDKILETFFLRNSDIYECGLKVSFRGYDEFYIPYGKSEKVKLKSSQHNRRWRMRNGHDYIRCMDAGMLFSKALLLYQLHGYVQQHISEYRSHLIQKQMELLENMSDEIIFVADDVEPFVKEYLQNYDGKKTLRYVTEQQVSSTVFRNMNFLYLAVLQEELPETFISQLCLFYCAPLTLIKLFAFVYEKYSEKKQYAKYLSGLKSEYAKVFMTKKTISKKVVHAMEQSTLNHHFDYVEFDNDVDLSLMAEIENEWNALLEYMQLSKRENVSVRFRKLGQHKAAGLYYPGYKCICVDVRYPGSMVHEYMHMLDDVSGQASWQDAFADVLECYRTCVKKALDADSNAKQMMENKKGTKYDLFYYLQSTEAFARCGEMYVTQCLHVNNSLARPDGGFAYPDKPELLEKIRSYFDSFLGLDSRTIGLNDVS